ncbi:hypothetical protein QYE76_019828 [Lolium multiflorum]|uniref:SWIM-type domain-containing protein n=1 Tax=Lolium multiflorum TaxID=4521 RepID=A0AAD8R4P9_LOLMU|nr:hypothetical protein QYE76_019828 [Lolium multiflorum]
MEPPAATPKGSRTKWRSQAELQSSAASRSTRTWGTSTPMVAAASSALKKKLPTTRSGFSVVPVLGVGPIYYPVLEKTGLASLLATRLVGIVDRRFYVSCLDSLNPETMDMTFKDGQVRRVTREEIVRVLGVRSGGKTIQRLKSRLSTKVRGDQIEAIQALLQMPVDRSAGISMEDLKKVFQSCDVASLTPGQIRAAQVAYTLLVCSTYIAPRQAIPSIPEEVMGVVIRPDKLHEYDWAGYVVAQMQTAAARLKMDKESGSDIYVLGGCPLAAAMDGSMASRIDNEKASTDVDDSRWEGYDISSSEDEYEVPSSDDDDSIFGDPVSESDNMDIDDEDNISDTHDEPTSENTSDVVVIRNSELTYYGDSDLEDFAYKEDVPEQSKSLEGGVSQLSKSECKSEVTGSSQLDHTKHEDYKDPYDIDTEMNQRKYEAVMAMIFVSEEAAYYFYNKKMKDHQKSRIMSLAAAGMRLFNIMRSFISDSGKYSTVGFVRKDLYNMSCREKMKMIAKGDANTTIGIMEKRKRDDPEFFFDYKLGKGGELLHLFWCDSQSRQDYADFGDVLVFDSTYKTNRYAMPFIPFVGINNHRQTTVFACAIVSDEKEKTYKWLLETFLKAMYQQKPKGIITDGDAAMIAAVGKVFPGVWYRVCTWHIEKNMKKHLDSVAHNEFRSLLYYSTSEQVFEERWRAFVEKHQTALTKEWMKRMYARKKLWSAAYLANGYFLGMKSNQRSESLNSTLHTHLDFGLTIVDMVVHYENNSSRVREEEARHDAIDSQTLPVAVTRYKDIETSAAHKFTAANFYLVQEELKKIGGLEIVDQLGCVGGVSTFVVSWMNNRKYLFSVDYRPESKEETITCSCRRMYRKGLPCKHILFVLHYVGCSEIPNCCVLRRFSKNARYGLPSRRESDLYGWGWEGVAERRKHSELTMIGAEAFDAALHDPESFSELMQCMKGIIYRRKGAQTSHSTAYHEDAQNRGDAPVVGDPDMAETKGAPKQNKRYYKDKDTNQQTSKHGRILAHDERKKERLCTACNQPGHNRNNKMKCRLHKE